MGKIFARLQAMLHYAAFLAMLVPTLLLATAAAISLSETPRPADGPTLILPIQGTCERCY